MYYSCLSLEMDGLFLLGLVVYACRRVYVSPWTREMCCFTPVTYYYSRAHRIQSTTVVILHSALDDGARYYSMPHIARVVGLDV